VVVCEPPRPAAPAPLSNSTPQVEGITVEDEMEEAERTREEHRQAQEAQVARERQEAARRAQKKSAQGGWRRLVYAGGARAGAGREGGGWAGAVGARGAVQGGLACKHLQAARGARPRGVVAVEQAS